MENQIKVNQEQNQSDLQNNQVKINRSRNVDMSEQSQFQQT